MFDTGTPVCDILIFQTKMFLIISFDFGQGIFLNKFNNLNFKFYIHFFVRKIRWALSAHTDGEIRQDFQIFNAK